MDLLKREEGVSIIESLVSIVILGVIVMMTVIVIKGIFTNPRALLKGEACQIASQEIDYALRYKPVTDSIYKNAKGNLLLSRQISHADSLTRIDVKVTYVGTGEEVVTLGVYDYR